MLEEELKETNKTYDRILDAATEVIAVEGYSGAGIQEIIELANTSKGSFYFHFPSKEQMVFALVDRMSDKLIQRVRNSVKDEPSAVHRVAASIEVLMQTFANQRKVAQVLFLNIVGHGKATDKVFLPIRDRFSLMIQEEFDTAMEMGQIGIIDKVLISQMWVGALHEVILRWLLTGRPDPLTNATAELRSALLRSIGVDPKSLNTNNVPRHPTNV